MSRNDNVPPGPSRLARHGKVSCVKCLEWVWRWVTVEFLLIFLKVYQASLRPNVWSGKWPLHNPDNSRIIQLACCQHTKWSCPKKDKGQCCVVMLGCVQSEVSTVCGQGLSLWWEKETPSVHNCSASIKSLVTPASDTNWSHHPAFFLIKEGPLAWQVGVPLQLTANMSTLVLVSPNSCGFCSQHCT